MIRLDEVFWMMDCPMQAGSFGGTAGGGNALSIAAFSVATVDTTTRRAYSLGYDVTLVQDGHSTWDSPDLRAPQIIAHHNRVLGGWFAALQAASEIDFGSAAA